MLAVAIMCVMGCEQRFGAVSCCGRCRERRQTLQESYIRRGSGSGVDGSSFRSAFVMRSSCAAMGQCSQGLSGPPQAQTGTPADDDARVRHCCAGSAWSGHSCTARLPVLLFATQHHFDGLLGSCIGRAAETLTQLHQLAVRSVLVTYAPLSLAGLPTAQVLPPSNATGSLDPSACPGWSCLHDCARSHQSVVLYPSCLLGRLNWHHR